VLNRYQVLFK